MRASSKRVLLGILAFALLVGASHGQTVARGLCDAEHVPIGSVQGAGRRSPMAGDAVTVQGTVTASFRGADSLGGVFVQDADGDPATSDGLFVRIRGDGASGDGAAGDVAPGGIAPGDKVAVRGTVFERNEMTQLDRLEAVEVCGYGGLVEPTIVSLPVTSPTAWEAYEGMLVAFAEPLVVAEAYNVGRYGELLLADARPFVPTNGNGDPGADHALRSIALDDGRSTENPEPVPYLGPDLTVRVGDTVHDLSAVVFHHGLGAYRLEPAAAPRIVRSNPRPEAPADVGGSVRAAAFNVLNYFTTLGDRGADDPEELERQTRKLVAALAGADADVVGLVEIENNGAEAVQALADALNEAVGGAGWVALPDPGTGVGDDRIKQAILYRPDVLEPIGSASDPDPVHDRPPVAGTFRHRASGAVFSAIVVHFKSKGGCPPAGDVDRGFGCWDARRSAQAQAVIDFADRIATATGDPDVLILGDLNSYRLEPPVRLFERAGFVNLDAMMPEGERYTYVYFGASGTLDYALASASLADQVAGAVNWHINADEPPVTDYDRTYNPAGLYRPFPYRSSDHDPVVVGLELE